MLGGGLLLVGLVELGFKDPTFSRAEDCESSWHSLTPLGGALLGRVVDLRLERPVQLVFFFSFLFIRTFWRQSSFEFLARQLLLPS